MTLPKASIPLSLLFRFGLSEMFKTSKDSNLGAVLTHVLRGCTLACVCTCTSLSCHFFSIQPISNNTSQPISDDNRTSQPSGESSQISQPIVNRNSSFRPISSNAQCPQALEVDPTEQAIETEENKQVL